MCKWGRTWKYYLFYEMGDASKKVKISLFNMCTTSEPQEWHFNSLSASLLLNIFLSFEVGIAHAIANFK